MELIKKVIDKDFPEELMIETEELAKKELYSPIWQTIGWNLMLQESGYSQPGTFIGIRQDDKLINYVIVERRKVGFGMYGNFIIGGPINEIGIEALEDAIISSSKEQGAVFTQIEPLSEIRFNRFKKGCFKKFIEPNTAVVDLTQENEQILSNMKQKGRYNIRIAEKNGISVEKAGYSEENVKVFYDLLNETTVRNGFNVNSLEYFGIFCRYLDKNRLGELYFAKKDGEVLAAGVFVLFGRCAVYYYGASTSDNEKRKYMPAYLLQWSVMIEAKEKGFEAFDFLGIASKNDTGSRLAGVTDFKLKLTNKTVTWPESYIFIHSKMGYILLSLKNKLKKIRDEK